MKLRDRRFLVIGGTGGIGRELLEPLMVAGARLLVATRHPEPGGLPGGVAVVKLDLMADDLESQLAAITEAWPDLDGVIHCAGQNRFSAIQDSSVADIDSQIMVNLRSAMLVARHFVPILAERKGGALVFVGSTFGSIGYPGYTTYCATKFGLRGFTEALRRELADTPVGVLHIAPRATRTAMNPSAVDQLNQALGNAMDSPQAVAARIVRAMSQDQGRCFIGWPERLFVVLNGILPRLVDRAIIKQLPVIRRYLDSGVSS